jgi:hypothetical protein
MTSSSDTQLLAVGDELSVVIHDSGRAFTLTQPAVFTKAGITVPCGFRTDFASVPRILWSVFPPNGYYHRAALLHDWLYRMPSSRGDVTRAEADRLFYDQMRVDGVPWRTRYILWLAVRVAGASSWRTIHA